MTALSLSKSNTDVHEPSTIDSADARESSTVYSTDLTDIAFPEPYTVLPPGSQNSSPNAFYSYLNSFW